MPSPLLRSAAAAPLVLLAVACASAPPAATPAPAAPAAAPVPYSQQPAAPAPAQARPTPPARPEDVASEEAIVKALYGVISGPAGPRDWDRLRSLFTPEARFIFAVTQQDGSTRFREGTVEQYIAVNAPYLMEHSWSEHEISRRVARFGSIAHVWSTYEGNEGPGTEAERGIDSIQLVRHGGRWWIASLAVDNQAPWNPIPAEYLP